jgi:hypothetical protein
MQLQQVLRFGVILVLELDTRRQGLSDTMAEVYTILHKGEVLHKNLTEEEYFDIMEDLSIEYYQTGSPRPQDLETKIIQRY